MLRLLLSLILLLAGGMLHAEVPVPELKARVTDLTGTLNAQEQAALENRLAMLEQERGSQIAVLLVPGTAPETIEQYGIRVAEQWRLGRQGTDDGLLLIIAKNERALRIEVGYGLEGAIPDAIAKRVIAETIVPRFQSGDFAGGINAGIDQLAGLIAGEQLPPPPRQRASGDRGDNPLGMILIGALFLGQFLRAVLGPLLGGGLVGASAFGLALALGGGLPMALALGVGGFLVTALGLFSLLSSGGGRGGYGGGGFGHGGGFGGGGFGGGGGGFGGGGASGQW